MQIEYAAFKRMWQSTFKFWPLVVFIFVAILWCDAGYIHANAENPEVLYTQSGSNPFSVTLVSDDKTEILPDDDNLVKVSINGKTVPFEFSADQQGQITISGSLPGLPDGKHNAAIETYTPDKQRIDGRQALFFVDSIPPVIELVEPEGPLPRTSSSLLFAVNDNENGAGVVAEPEASDLQVNITGAKVFSKAFVLKDNALHLLVTVKFKESIISPDYHFNVSISLKDRAGNIGKFSREFATAGLIQPEFIRRCKKDDTSILTALGFLVYPKEKGLQLQSGETRSLSLLMYGNYGKNYTYPSIRVNDHGETAPEFTQLSKFFQRELGRRIEIIASSGDIIVEKQADQDLTDDRIAFDVTQKSAVSMGNQVGAIQVKVPVAFSLDKTINYCPYDDYENIPQSAFTYTYETVSIPVVLEVVSQPVKMRLLQEGDKLISQVRFNPIDLMDTAASWFEIDGEKYWYAATGDMCIAKGPVREGTVPYRVAAAHTFAVFRDAGDDSAAGERIVVNEGEFIVRMSPPAISGFTYDRQTNTLQAIITDEGTPAGDLDIELGLPGSNIAFDFDADTGQLKAVLAFTPLSVVDAALRVIDRAGQATSANCRIFGNPASNASTGEASTTSAQYKAVNVSTGTQLIGAVENGMHLVKVCTKGALQTGIYNNGKFIPVSPGSATLVRLRLKGSARNLSAAELQRRMGGGGGNEGLKIFYNQYDASLFEPVGQSGHYTQLSLTGGSSNAAGGRQKIYYITGYFRGGRFVSTNYNVGLKFSTKAVQTCRVEKRDISSPVIQAAYDSSSGDITGSIHDNGRSLSGLKVKFSGRNDSSNRHRYRQALPFRFEGGRFRGRFESPARGECFILEIKAVDAAGNTGIFTLKIVIPRSPPEVQIQVETEASDLVFSSSTQDINTYMTAEASDESELVPGGTTFWLDGQVLTRFNHPDTTPYQMRSSAFTRSNFNYQGMYAAKITEGPHTARFRATDSTGLSAETTRQFAFSLAPVIRDLKVMPGAVLKAGGPVFTAMVIDRGGDLDASGLSVDVNGEPVAVNRLYYDPASGYFAVDGPLELADGRHTAQVTAVDNRGNRAEASVQFIRRLQVMLTPGLEDGSDIAIDAVSLMELRDHNGDGQANPGELIRVFIPLRNDSQYGREACRGSLLTGNEKITVETGSVLYGRIDPGAVSIPMKGFDLQINKAVLDGIVSDPYDIYFDLTVTCDSGKEQRLPLVLPVYRPSVPVDISSAVKVELDNMAPTTTLGAVQVRGEVTSTGAFIDTVVVRVNGAVAIPALFNRDGGRFEATVPLEEGPNVIEVEATDQTGARGYVTRYIHRAPAFVPPSIAITSPANNTFFQCDNLTVTGTYNPGSSNLERITINAPLWAFDVVCPVTIVDESHFIGNCGPITMNGGVYNVEAILETTQGVQVQASMGIIVGDCF